MLIAYPAIFHSEDGYWVEFPDLPGCQTEGDTLEDAFLNAQEALGLYLCVQREKDIRTPLPSDIKGVDMPEDGFIGIVTTNPDMYEKRNKAVKKTLTIPGWLNERAQKAGINYSQILQEALKKKLGVL